MQNKSNLKKPTKTISGVTPVAVMLPPRGCNHGACVFCPTLNVPQSYTPLSPVVLRASSVNYDPKKQVLMRLEAFRMMGHPTDKIELIIMGGTCMQYPEKFQINFMKSCYDALNGKDSETLDQAKRLNEKAKHRCVALCLETRPDTCSDEEVARMLKLGATRVEIGVQALDDEIYKINNRCHDVAAVVEATKKLKKAGFKLGYHLMPGLPGSNLKKDVKLIKKVFSDKRFRPDQAKIYPCQVLKGSQLEKWFYEKKYISYTPQETKELLIKIMQVIPRYCRVMRMLREIPPAYLVSGLINIDMRKDLEQEIRERKIKVKEIRFREIGFALRDKRKISPELKLKTTKYEASGGKEYFLEYVNKEDVIFGLIRLRIEKDSKEAMIRELHVYGPSLNIGKHEQEKWQHKGLGKQLLEEAEKICKKNKIKKLRIISGVGVREYYRKFGYEVDKDNIYVEKEL